MTFLSICIPTRNRLQYLSCVVESIINTSIDKAYYEIVISDNSDDDKTKYYIENLISNGFENIIYYKNPKKGFYNSIKSLSLGTGHLLKLHNDYSKFTEDGLKRVVQYARDEYINTPPIFFSNGALNMRGQQQMRLSSFDEFVRLTSFYNTWSSAFSIWKCHFDALPHAEVDVDSMFPHTSLFLSFESEEYIVDNSEIMVNIQVEKKGGYNIFFNFCVLYLSMLKDKVKSNRISESTYNNVKWKMLFKFVFPWYYRTIFTKQGYTFDGSDSKENIINAYGRSGLFFVIVLCCVFHVKNIIISALSRL